MPKKKLRALDKATREYYQRKAWLEMPGWIAGFISIATLITGILLKVNTVLVIGVLLLAIAAYCVIMGRIAHQTLFRK